MATMRRSWLGLQLLLSGALLLAVVAVEGRCCKEEESYSEEERHCEKRHHCVEECCEKRHHHEEEECCCEKRHHHEEEECCCMKRCHHEEEECCCVKRHSHAEEESGKKKHSHAVEEAGEKKHSHAEEESGEKEHSHGKKEPGKKKHSHGKKESCKKKHSHAEEESGEKKDSRVEEEEEESGKKKDRDVKKKRPKKRHPLFEDLEEGSSESSEIYKDLAKDERKRIMELAAQTSDAVPHYRKEQAIAHFNRGTEGSYYKHLEDGQLEFKKALGVMVYVQMLLGQTNCTKPKEQEVAGVEYSRAYLEKEGCQLLPQLKQKHNCTFGIFIDMRTEKRAVVSRECTIIPGIKQLFKPFKGLGF